MKLGKRQKESKKEKINQVDSASRGRVLRKGAYSSIMIVIVLAIVILINMIVGRLPSKYIKFDLTNEGLYSISEESEKLIKAIKEPVKLYYLVSSTAENTSADVAMVSELLEKYTELNSNIKVEKKDPAVYPTFAETYEADSTTALIVESDKRYKAVSANEIFETTYDYSTYEQITNFNGEETITSAINYVVTEKIPNLYVLQGHKETELSETIKTVIGRQSIVLNDLNLITEDTVPEDADCIFINEPKADFTEAEANKMIDYLKNGGNAVIITSYKETDLPNFDKVLAEYGVQLEKKLIFDSNSSNLVGSSQVNIVPSIATHDITKTFTENYFSVCLPEAQPIIISDDIRDTVTVTELLTTSETSYAKADAANVTSSDKKADDAEGPFTVGAVITETEETEEETEEEETVDDSEAKTKIILYSSYGMTDDTINQSYVNWTNAQLVIDSINWICKYEDNISIPSKSMSTDYLTITENQVILWGTIYMGLIPILIITTGVVVMIRRRRR